MGYTIEHKIIHHEWDEAIIDADTFFQLYEVAFSDDDDDESKLSTHGYYPTFCFEHGNVYCDEMWGVNNGKVWTSSYGNGILGDDDKGEYVKLLYGHRYKMGDLVKVEIRLDEHLKIELEKLNARQK